MPDISGPLLDAVNSDFAVRKDSFRIIKKGRATVVRVSRSGTGSADGSTGLIIKVFGSESREHFIRERAGLNALGKISRLEGFVPRLVGSYDSFSALVMEEVLSDGFLDLSKARTSDLCAIAERLGTIHALAREVLPAFGKELSGLETAGVRFEKAVPAILSFCRRALGDGRSDLLDDDELKAALVDVARKVDKPDPLTTVTLGDMAPSNIMMTPRGPVMLDLEYCAPRHAFYDAMFWRCIVVFPGDIADRMEECYRSGLEAGGVVVEQQRFFEQMILFFSHRLFWTLSWNMEPLFGLDRDFVPGVSSRFIIRSYLRNFLAYSSKRTSRGVLERVASELLERLDLLWDWPDP
jgi:hypothetical protein